MKLNTMKLNTKHLTAALYAAVILTNSAFADAPWPSRPEYPAQQENVSKVAAVKTTTARAKRTATIATFVPRPVTNVPVSLPHNFGNSGL